MYEQDYVMRMIHEAARMIVKMLFGREIKEDEPIVFENEENNEQFVKLVQMVKEGKINEAENLLYEILEVSDKSGLEMALLFYDHINDLEDDFLQRADYSRGEINEGIRKVVKMYGYEGLTALFEIQ